MRSARKWVRLWIAHRWIEFFLPLVCLAALIDPGFARQDQPSKPPQFERLGPYGGDVRSLLISWRDPKTVYLGSSDGQLYKSTDGGSSWLHLFPGIGRRQYVVDTLIQHPRDPERIYAGAWDLRSNGGGLFESRDGGRSWTPVPLPHASPAIRDFAICPSSPNHMIAGTLAGGYVSDDGGATWRQVAVNLEGMQKGESVAIDPRDPNLLFIGTWRLGYRSTDFGKTWKRAEQGMLLDSDVFSIAVDPQNPEIVYASACSGIYRSANRGVSWTRLKVLPNSFSVRAQLVYIDPADSHRIFGGTTEGLFMSHDDGHTWTRVTSARLTINAVQVDRTDHRRIMLGTDDHGVLISQDGGRTWTESNSGFVHRQISRIVPDPDGSDRFFTGVLSDGRQSGFYLFDSNHNRWTPLTSEIASGVELLSFLSLPRNNTWIAGTARGIYWRRTAAGARWTKLEGPTSRLVINELAFDARENWIYAATGDGIYRSLPGKLNFVKPQDSRLSPRAFSLAISNGAPSLVYAGTSLGVLRSGNNGSTWETLSNGLPNRAAVEALAICPAEKDHLFAGTYAGLFESKDGGASWQKASDGRLGVDVPAVIFLDAKGSKIMAADHTFGGVFLSIDGGLSWEKIEAPEFSSPVRHLAQDPIRPSWIYLGTNSDGVYRLRLGESFLARSSP